MFGKQVQERVGLLTSTVLMLMLITLACSLQPAGTPVSTGTPEPTTLTNAPVSPTPTSIPTPIPQPSTSWYGVVRASVNDWPTIRENLGGSVVDLVVQPSAPLSDIIASLDSAQALGYRVIFHIYDRHTPTRKPWYLDGSWQWVFPQYAVDVLRAVSDHPAIFAIYALHEPFDSSDYYAGVEEQQALYALLKEHTGGLPVYTDIGGLAVFEARGEALADGMCDLCCTFPTHFRADWTAEQTLAEAIRRIDADRDTQQRLMPDSQIVSLINTYALAGYRVPFRMPTAHEVDQVRDYLCSLKQPFLYIPWHHSSYDQTLEDAPELWPVIVQGCDG